MIETILVPYDRRGVIKHKKTRQEITKKLSIKITFEENNVILEGEGLELYTAKNIVKAIARGFSPPKAFRLFNEKESLEIIDLIFSDKKNSRIKSRVIGSNGKTRREIEFYTKASISIYGKTISIIGTYEQIENAKEAVKMLISGAGHKTVYDFLRRLQ
ncbi:MAG: KH domain-containing protein [Candidatus Aenigmarchaeota archaeon]|nr:KH domain-containing protein [Candidatus Aenigmarchaeota archaeon]